MRVYIASLQSLSQNFDNLEVIITLVFLHIHKLIKHKQKVARPEVVSSPASEIAPASLVDI